MSLDRRRWIALLAAPLVWALAWAVGMWFVDRSGTDLPLWLASGVTIGFAIRFGVTSVLAVAVTAFGLTMLLDGTLLTAGLRSFSVTLEGFTAAGLMSLWGRPGASVWRAADWVGIVAWAVTVPTLLGSLASGAIGVALSEQPLAMASGMALAKWGSHATGALLVAPVVLRGGSFCFGLCRPWVKRGRLLGLWTRRSWSDANDTPAPGWRRGGAGGIGVITPHSRCSLAKSPRGFAAWGWPSWARPRPIPAPCPCCR